MRAAREKRRETRDSKGARVAIFFSRAIRMMEQEQQKPPQSIVRTLRPLIRKVLSLFSNFGARSERTRERTAKPRGVGKRRSFPAPRTRVTSCTAVT